VQNNAFYTNKTLNIRGRLVDLAVPQVMGILNVTPDSFFDGGKFKDEGAIVAHVMTMVEDGAAMVDVGGASSRPGAEEISAEEELSRVLPAIKAIVRAIPGVIVSIDTVRASVATRALDEGASMINDISAGQQDVNMLETVAHADVPYIIMHMRGTPRTMNDLTKYDNLIKDITDYFHKKIEILHAAGIKDIIIDPGFGFAKTTAQNFELLRHLDYLRILGVPVLAGLSRKSMIWKTLGITADDALNGTTVLNTTALLKGASILRVHDVKAARQCIQLVTRILS
jgi:dihydropteroate synthase